MFNWIGSKIKGFTKFICWVGIIGSVLLGISLGSMSPVAGLLIALVGSLLSWISSFVLYGFGELIDSVMQINDLLSRTDGIGVKKEIPSIWYCTSCGQQNTNISAQCKKCGKYRE